jgi:hypothetical protein
MSHNELTIKAIKEWQADASIHPMTCGNDSTHRVLEPIEDHGKVILKCPDCDYVQYWIPEVVIK